MNPPARTGDDGAEFWKSRKNRTPSATRKSASDLPDRSTIRSSLLDELEKLSALHQKGSLTDTEWITLKHRALSPEDPRGAARRAHDERLDYARALHEDGRYTYSQLIEFEQVSRAELERELDRSNSRSKAGSMHVAPGRATSTIPPDGAPRTTGSQHNKKAFDMRPLAAAVAIAGALTGLAVIVSVNDSSQHRSPSDHTNTSTRQASEPTYSAPMSYEDRIRADERSRIRHEEDMANRNNVLER